MHDRKKMKTPTGSSCHSTSLLKSSVVNVFSNDVTNNLKKKVQRKKLLKISQVLVNYELNFLTPQPVKLS